MKKIIILVNLILAGVFISLADEADFSYTNVCEGSSVLFTSNSSTTSGTIISYKWDFNNDGNFNDATGPKVSYSFSNSGSYNIGLRITNSNSTVTTKYKTVVVNPIATANFMVNDGCSGEKILLSDNSTLSLGSIVKYKWDLDNDGKYDDSSSNKLNFVKWMPGSYTVGHEVVTEKGCISSVKKTFVINAVPTLDFTFNYTCLNDVTEFSATSSISNGYIKDYKWNFNGDGIYEETTTNGMNSTTFANFGYHNVQVKVTSDKGCSKDTSKLVEITYRPTLNFTFSNLCENKEVIFDNSFSNANTYNWNFGDGNTTIDENPTHIYNIAGSYDIKLIGSSAIGCSDSITKSINIHPTPIADFSFSNVCIGDRMLFSDMSQGNNSTIAGYLWDFGDGHGEITKNPIHEYNQADSFKVNLTIKNQYECEDFQEKWVHVFDLPNPNISASGPVSFCQGDDVDLSVNLNSGENVIWSNGEITNQITVDKTKRFFAIVYDDNGCQNKDSVDITVFPLPDIKINVTDTSISKGKFVELYASGGVDYAWNPTIALSNPYSYSTIANPLQNVDYTLTVTSENDCVSKKLVSIDVIEDYLIDVENMITPNGDGKNDIWDINLSIYDDNEVIIYNKWGTEIFRQRNYQDNWGGTYNGEVLPDGTYYYLIRFDNSDKTYKGSLTILR
jgi:gliding motility-associated-like protein